MQKNMETEQLSGILAAEKTTCNLQSSKEELKKLTDFQGFLRSVRFFKLRIF